MRRAQSVSICENTLVDMQRRTSLSRTRPATPSKTFTTTTTPTANATIVNFDCRENCKNGNGN